MRRLRVVPIVEGHGEDASLRTLLQRMGNEIFDAYIEVSRPIRGKRMKLIRLGELERNIGHAVRRPREMESEDPAVILILLDADNDLPCQLGPAILGLAQAARGDMDVSCCKAGAVS